MNSLRINAKVYHVACDWQDERNLLTFCNLLKSKNHIHSLSPVDSRFNLEAMEVICQCIEWRDPKREAYRVNSLNLDFCYLEGAVFERLTKAVCVSTTLIKLVLSNNMLG